MNLGTSIPRRIKNVLTIGRVNNGRPAVCVIGWVKFVAFLFVSLTHSLAGVSVLRRPWKSLDPKAHPRYPPKGSKDRNIRDVLVLFCVLTCVATAEAVIGEIQFPKRALSVMK